MLQGLDITSVLVKSDELADVTVVCFLLSVAAHMNTALHNTLMYILPYFIYPKCLDIVFGPE